MPEALKPQEADPQAKQPTRPKVQIPLNGSRTFNHAVPVRLDIGPDLARHLSDAAPQVDQKTYRKMKRGKLTPEARMDLHGMTLAVAHTALTRFVLTSAAKQRRLVLVITGKGRAESSGDVIPQRRGVLRHQVPAWLYAPPLSAHVVQVVPAHISHGGEGAYYVYLRRKR